MKSLKTFIQLDGSEVELDTEDIVEMDEQVKGDHESAPTEFTSITMADGRVYQVLPKGKK